MRTAREIPACVLKTDRTQYQVDKSRKISEATTAASAFSHAPLHASRFVQPWQVSLDRDASRTFLIDAGHENYAQRIITPPAFRRMSPADLHFKIWHRFRAPGTACAPGEEVAAVSFASRQCEFHLPLSLTLRLVFDLLAKHRHVPLGASQIAASFKADPFYRKHGCNALNGGALIRRVSISSVRVYIERICRAMAVSLREANLQIDPRDVLVSQETVTNEVGYRLRGTFEWVHTDHPGPEFAWVK